MKTIKFLLVILFSITVAACSGGGGSAAPPAAALGTLNDTGQTLCYNDTTAATCATVAINTGTHPRQDALFGRDANTTLVKVGAGAAGFDFTKVCFDGTLNCATAVSNAATPAATDWACTKDNHTNLIWSLQTQSDTWTNATSTLLTTANTANRCGFSTGWRLPTRRELLSIVHNNTSNPSIDTTYFPATTSNSYWSNDTYAPSPAFAWHVDFGVGNSSATFKTNSFQVRLVRSGQ